MHPPSSAERAFRRRFLLLTGVWAVLVTAALAVPPLVLRDRLPDPVAMHWGLSGRPDRAYPYPVLFVFPVVWAVVSGGILAAAARGRAPLRRFRRVWLTAGLAWNAAWLLGTEVLVIGANLGRAAWTDAAPMTWQVVAMLAVSAAVGGLGWLAGWPGPDVRPAAAPPPPAMALAPRERPVWVSTVSARWLLALSLVLFAAALSLALAALLGRPGPLWGPAALLAIVAVAGLTLSSVAVRVTRDGLTIAFGPLRWPVRRVPLHRIERAWTDERSPAEVGGWGYRGLPGSATIMLRGGECLVIRYTTGGELAISVDDAATGAALLNAYVSAARPSGG